MIIYKLRTYITFKLIFWMFTFLPGYYVISNVRQIHEAEMLRENGLKVKAKVVSVKTTIVSTEDGSATHYILTVKYKISDGVEYVRELQRHKTAYTENDEIEMLYYSNKGSEAIPNSYFFFSKV